MDLVCKCLSTDTWYNNLEKPRYTPSKALFAVLETIVYGFIGAAMYLYIRNTENHSR